MIKYEQLETETDGKKDVKVITDDASGELAELEDTFKNSEAADTQTCKNLQAAERSDGGLTEFIIPGNEVGDMSDLFWEVDNGTLDQAMDRWNEATLRDLGS